MQQIVAQLLFNGLKVEVAEMSPWLDLRVSPKDVKLAELEAQTVASSKRICRSMHWCFLRKPVHLPWTGWTDVVWSL